MNTNRSIVKTHPLAKLLEKEMSKLNLVEFAAQPLQDLEKAKEGLKDQHPAALELLPQLEEDDVITN